jgi:hypothetical protein
MTTTKKAGTGKKLADALYEGRITETGKDAAGRKMANVAFPDGTLGGIDYEVLRQHMVSQGRSNRAILEALGYKVTMTCVAGLHGSAAYENAAGDRLEINGTKMNRITRHLGEELKPGEHQDLLRRSLGLTKKAWAKIKGAR